MSLKGNYYQENGRYTAEQLDIKDAVIAGVGIISVAGVPTAGAPKGSIALDTANGDMYINQGDAETPDWKKVAVSA